ncbi:Multidrug resistance protein NorM [Stieleria maiorica]|uniref:Multidrug resistance protein NorM n=1 Tax=Stieleria maiorica TaxID=2795974 RepID=A0A5B9MML0_9BACT|nr:MATE family efflux transporter [Stieleria maiorica]QEG01157.1 Multidrug resistance protein NorM [Stieleria maiorica]
MSEISGGRHDLAQPADLAPRPGAADDLPVPTNLAQAAIEVLRVAVPLMISAGMMSVVLFADRTLLMFYDGASMSASMAGGNLFWVVVCVPIGAAAMTGAVIGQLIGNGEPEKVGRLLWQSIWLSLMTVPFFVAAFLGAESLFRLTGQPEELIAAEATYMRWLMLGGLGLVIESALSGFFSGTERTSVIMWVSVASGLLNVVLDVVLIFGWGGLPALGIAGAAIGSVIAFWFKVVCYSWLLSRPGLESRYRMRGGFGLDLPMLRNFLYYSLPSGLMYLTEAGAFTIIILRIGQLGDVPLRATTMAINFNMVAFIPLVGIAIAASVLVGRHLLQNGPAFAVRTSLASLLIALFYSGVWAIAYLVAGDWMLSLYGLGTPDEDSRQAILLAGGLLGFVASYVLVDAVQLILSAALKGAGDTWFVLAAGAATSALSIAAGIAFDPGRSSLTWWWWVITIWIWALAIAMTTRFLGGRWKSMRMV